MVLVELVEKAAVVGGVELAELAVCDFGDAHEEWGVDMDGRERSFVGRAVETSHDKAAFGDDYQFHRDAVAEVDGCWGICSGGGSGLAVFRGAAVEGPAGAGDFPGGGFESRLGHDGVDGRGVNGGYRFGVVVAVGVGDEHFESPLSEVAADFAMLGPCSVVGDVEVDPCDDAVPCFGIEADVVMAFFQHLDEFAGVDVVFVGVGEMVVAFKAGAADVWMKRDVGGGEVVPAVLLRGGEVGDVRGGWLGVVAGDAVFVEDWLDFAFEAEAPCRAAPWGDFDGSAA